MTGRFHTDDDVLEPMFSGNLLELAKEQLKALSVVFKCNWLPELDSAVVLCSSHMFEFGDVDTDN